MGLERASRNQIAVHFLYLFSLIGTYSFTPGSEMIFFVEKLITTMSVKVLKGYSFEGINLLC